MHSEIPTLSDGQRSTCIRNQALLIAQQAEARQCDASKPSANLPSPSGSSGTFRHVEISKLQAHPAYIRHGLSVSSAQIATLVGIGEFAFNDPLLITSGGLVLDGYGRWELAKRQGRQLLPCIEVCVSEADSIRWLLNRHRRLKGLTNFSRILIALELEATLREQASENQRIGGQCKGSSNLTEASRLDVRKEIAAAAGVSVGNVTKVKQILASAAPELIEALKSGQLSIHMAWTWSKMGLNAQRRELENNRDQHSMRKFIHKRISHHRKARENPARNVQTLVTQLTGCDPLTLKSVQVSILKTPGRTVFISEELSHILNCQQVPLCVTNDR
jgi:hypothetical protein